MTLAWKKGADKTNEIKTAPIVLDILAKPRLLAGKIVTMSRPAPTAIPVAPKPHRLVRRPWPSRLAGQNFQEGLIL
jgi:hypothetical protein